MALKEKKKISLAQFITWIVVLVLVIISVIFVVISQTMTNVKRNTQDHAIADMKENTEVYVKTIQFGLKVGVTLDEMLESDAYANMFLFVTDLDGNILARSNRSKYEIPEASVFLHFSGCEYIDTSPDIIFNYMHGHQVSSFSVRAAQTDTLVYRPLGDDMVLFYMLHQADAEQIYSDSREYIKTVRFFGIAYVTILVGLVILMGAYIISSLKLSEMKVNLSNQRVRTAQEQVRTYSDISRVLSSSYEKVYYINLSDGQYREFSSAPAKEGMPSHVKGEDFWGTVVPEIIARTADEDKDFVHSFFNENTLPDSVREAGSRNMRFRVLKDGAEVYYYSKAYLSETEGEHYLILGLKNVDALVSRDMKQLAEKDAALKRLEIYRSALLDNMLCCLEVDLSAGIIMDGPYVADGQNEMRRVELPEMKSPLRFDELADRWSRHLTSGDVGEFYKNNSCVHLCQEYENGRHLVETNYRAQWLDGTVRELRQNFYMSRRSQDNKIVALCVMYDMSEKVGRDRQIENLTEQLNQTRIKISTSQMQPHFLYNALGSIREIILEDPQYASDLVCDFTTHLRACIKSMATDELVPFSKEIENIKAYVNIEKMRFGDRMQIDFDIKNDDFKVVPLSIQPLVENAIRHGLYPKKNELGVVKISSFSQNGYDIIAVKDNGVGFDYPKVLQEIKEGKRDSTGILNLTLRLEKVMNAKVYFDSKIGEGTIVTVLIPEQNEEEDKS